MRELELLRMWRLAHVRVNEFRRGGKRRTSSSSATTTINRCCGSTWRYAVVVERDVVRVMIMDIEDRILLFRIREPLYPEEGTCWELPGAPFRKEPA